MKNLLIYINPARRFRDEYQILVKIQIDNSLSLGWEPEDILLVTNFDYEYNGVKAMVIDDSNFCDFDKRLSKINAIVTLFEKGVIEKKQLYWYHDLDAYQLEVITEAELGLENMDAGFITVGWSKSWNTGSFFFKEKARDIFRKIKNNIYKYKIIEEHALKLLTDSCEVPENRYKVLNVTYNIIMYRVPSNYAKATKPLKVLHFHAIRKKRIPVLDIFLRGKNEMGIFLMPERLIKIFNAYGIK